MARPARLKADRTACINRIRGLLGEFGLVFAQSPAALESVLADVLEDASNEMNTLARLVLQRVQRQWREIEDRRAQGPHRRACARQPGGADGPQTQRAISKWAAALKDRAGWQKQHQTLELLQKIRL